MKTRFSSELFVIVLGILALACAAFLIYAQVAAWRAAKEAVAQEEAGLARAQAVLQQLAKTKEQAGAMQEELARCERLLPAGPAEDALLNDIQNAANKCGVHFLRINFQPRVAKQGYVEMPFTLTCEGRYQGILNLLAELRAGPRALRIDGVKLGKGQKELPSLKAEITASAFFKPAGAVQKK